MDQANLMLALEEEVDKITGWAGLETQKPLVSDPIHHVILSKLLLAA